MTLEDLISLEEAIAEAEGLLSAAEWYWIQETESALSREAYPWLCS
jgi:hypothetical protein